MTKKRIAMTEIPAILYVVLKNKRKMGEAMKALWLVCFLAAALLAACNGDKNSAADITVIGDQDAIGDEDPSNDDGAATDADAKVPQSMAGGAQPWSGVLPTGQKKCYDLDKEIVCPASPEDPFHGQPAQFNQWKTRSFTVSGATVYDDQTHRTWQGSYACNLTWQEAYSYCSSLQIAGLSWRLPSPHELKSLINYGKLIGTPPNEVPAHPATDFPTDTPNDWFWASARVQDSQTAWIVYFYDGYMDFTVRTNRYCARCVATE